MCNPYRINSMARQHIPKYFGLRIYISSTILYFFLVFPFLVFLGLQNIPQRAESEGWFNRDAASVIDSLAASVDLDEVPGEAGIDSLVNRAIEMGEPYTENREDADDDSGSSLFVGISSEAEKEKHDHEGLFQESGPLPMYIRLLFIFTLVSYLIGFILNNPFKRFFRKKRGKREVRDRLGLLCKKYLLTIPALNSLIIVLPNLLVITYSLLYIILKNDFQGDIERELFVHLFFVTLAASLLEFLFAFYWQKHRVHTKYIEHLYTEEELRVRVFRRKGRIRNRYMIASVITTFLPLLIVMVYLVLSITSVKEMEMESLNRDQREILIGPYGTLLNFGKESTDIDKLEWLFYVNAVDSLLMSIGIGNGILVSLIYLLLFVKWTNQDITQPVKELLTNIRNTRGGDLEQYTLVRTNDEIGELAEGYNEMTRKIHEHVQRISKMNRDLEKTVDDRTREVVNQKEEIEAQKEEIEAQLDLVTLQKDTISRQNEQILDSIRYAERIQSALLPTAGHLDDFLSDQFILYKPRDIVSGDYYWTASKDGKLMVAVADCTGHGVPGAFLSVLGISSMNEFVKREEVLSAGQILEQLRDFVIHTLHQTGDRDGARDGIEIALCVIDPKKKTLEFAGANRPLYLVRKRRDKQGGGSPELIQIRGDRMPIGIYEQEPAPFTNHIVKLKKEDTLYLFSDGYVDQLGGPRRKTFRSAQFRELLIQIQDKPMEEQKKILYDKHQEWRGKVEQIDDILVAGFRI
ncbi:MAG: SpoIIE family protein phosphatase [Bacteroidota bacterium]